MITIDNFEMTYNKVKFTVSNGMTDELVEINLVKKGHTTMIDIYEFDFLTNAEWFELDKLVDVFSDILMCNAR